MKDAAVRPIEDVLVQELSDGESVLLNVRNERYYGLNATGTRMWDALLETGSLSGAQRRLEELYEVDREQLRSDLHEFVAGLHEAGLVEVDDV